MEKQGKQGNNNMILKFLPKAVCAVAFQSPPFSPGKDKRFCGPIVSIIPDEARRKTSKNESFETPEPTSPKVSCMGQIKHKKNIRKAKRATAAREGRDHNKPVSSPKEVKKHSSAVWRLFTSSKPPRKSDVPDETERSHSEDAPSLAQMKRFASRHDTLSGFDWTTQIAAVEGDHRRNCYSDGDQGGKGSDGEEEEEITSFSVPIMEAGRVPLEPKKEINLWKRRTTNPPTPLQLNRMVREN
ncbi:hypothetical protein SLEP1_g28249 [Rubroshorea leprosula]|uniref:Syringolide-induced protein 14-1-1 n=1 Tax=Rubroshorea leprosula TaxID=152421 RepID=A0AAV5JVN5_9ROSI|nr:hypothetical protein SLEP1_g28249 [Rubroshorea leprosula]